MDRREEDETLVRLEETRAALRDSIEKTKELAADSERLLRRHRAESRSAIPLKPDRQD